MFQDRVPAPPFLPNAVALILLGAFAGLAIASNWVTDPAGLVAVMTGLFLPMLFLLVLSCWPLLRKPKPAQTQTATEGSAS